MSFVKYTNEQLEDLINSLYAGSTTPDRLPRDLYLAILSRLSTSVKKGFGLRGSNVFPDGSPDELLYNYFQNNVSVFSGAKTHQQVKDMSSLVFKEDGFKRDFAEFRRLIKGDEFSEGIFNKYNDTWLRTEFETAFRTAQNGREWNAIVEDADVLPYLQYLTAEDERVRDRHKEFNGITLPVGHEFWDSHYPVNGFNCRCRTIQLSEVEVDDVTSEGELKTAPDVDSKLFSFNPGKKGFIFDPEVHPYFNIEERYSASASVNFGLPTVPKPVDPIVTPKLPK